MRNNDYIPLGSKGNTDIFIWLRFGVDGPRTKMKFRFDATIKHVTDHLEEEYGISNTGKNAVSCFLVNQVKPLWRDQRLREITAKGHGTYSTALILMEGRKIPTVVGRKPAPKPEKKPEKAYGSTASEESVAGKTKAPEAPPEAAPAVPVAPEPAAVVVSSTKPAALGEGATRRANKATSEIAAVNAVRAYATIYVVAGHLAQMRSHCNNRQWAECQLEGDMSQGVAAMFWPMAGVYSAGAMYGVPIFFLLNGFVLYLPYAGEEGRKEINTWSEYRTYFWKRAMRLLPLYYFNAIVTWSISTSVRLDEHVQYPRDQTTVDGYWKEIFLEIFAANQFSKSHFFPWSNGDLWCMGPIIWFSLFFYPIFLWLFKRSYPVLIAAAAMTFSLVIRLVAQMPHFGFALWDSYNQLGDCVLGRMDEMVMGMYLAHLYTTANWAGNPKFDKFLEKADTMSQAAVLIVGWLLVTWYTGVYKLMLGHGRYMAETDSRPAHWKEPTGYFLQILWSIKAIGLGFMIIGAIRIRSRIFRAIFITNPTVQMIGRMSFSIYVWHWYAVNTYYGAADVADFWHFLWSVIWCFPMVMLSYAYFEMEGPTNAYKMFTTFPEWEFNLTEGFLAWYRGGKVSWTFLEQEQDAANAQLTMEGLDLERGGLIHMGDLGLEDHEDVDPTDEFLSLTAAAMASDAMHGIMSPGVGNTPQASSPPSEGGDDIPRLNELAGIIEQE